MGKGKQNYDIKDVDINANSDSDDEVVVPERLQPAPSMVDLGNKFNLFTEFFLGINTEGGYRVRSQIPKGYHLKYTEEGAPYLESTEQEKVTDYMAATEHNRNIVNFQAPISKLAERFGLGVYMYFDFIKFLTIANLFIFLLGLISTAAHLIIDGWTREKNGEKIPFWWNFYISTFSPKIYLIWMITSCLSILCWFFFGPIYANRVARFFSQNNKIDFEHIYEANPGEDYIQENQRYDRQQRLCRSIISYLITFFVFGISAGSSIVFVILQENTGGYVYAIMIALVISFTNACWKFICKRLTKFEKHATWTSYRKNTTTKYYIFRMLNVLIVYVVRWALRRDQLSQINFNSSHNQTLNGYRCGIDEVGDQVLFMLLIEGTLGNAWEYFWPWLMWRMRKRKAEFGTTGNNSLRPEFDVSDEYLEILYRQFIIYLGTTVFPAIALIGLIMNRIDFTMDKYRLVRLCRKPNVLEGSMKKFVVFFLFTTCVFALISFPHGGVFVLGGFDFAGNPLCTPSVYKYNTTLHY